MTPTIQVMSLLFTCISLCVIYTKSLRDLLYHDGNQAPGVDLNQTTLLKNRSGWGNVSLSMDNFVNNAC